MKPHATRGFTLVEIMIVVSIIGIIIAIAIPAFLRARETSRGNACMENMTKIDAAKEQYALEFRLSQGAACSMTNLVSPGRATAGEGYLKAAPVCPSGGTYTVHNVGDDPTCSIHG